MMSTLLRAQPTNTDRFCLVEDCDEAKRVARLRVVLVEAVVIERHRRSGYDHSDGFHPCDAGLPDESTGAAD